MTLRGVIYAGNRSMLAAYPPGCVSTSWRRRLFGSPTVVRPRDTAVTSWQPCGPATCLRSSILPSHPSHRHTVTPSQSAPLRDVVTLVTDKPDASPAELFPGTNICADCGESYDEPGLLWRCRNHHAQP